VILADCLNMGRPGTKRPKAELLSAGPQIVYFARRKFARLPVANLPVAKWGENHKKYVIFRH